MVVEGAGGRKTGYPWVMVTRLRLPLLGAAMGVGATFALCGAIVAACGSNKSEFPSFPDAGPPDGTPEDTVLVLGSSSYSGPTSCTQAAMERSYIGCDYWPTITTNPVWSIFDFAAVVANAQSVAATVTVTGPNDVNMMVSVGPGAIEKIYLPWVTALKGPDSDSCGEVPIFGQSVYAPASAYHLVSSVPVTVYQFNALEYQASGGPPGKDWSSCPGTATLCSASDAGGGPSTHLGCFSYTNDASLLIPSTAMTGNYRVAGEHSAANQEGSYFAVTAVADSTHVTVTLSSKGAVVAGGNVTATPAGGTLNLTLDSGDVVEVMSELTSDDFDLSGSLVHADQPIQVIAGVQCTEQPEGYEACDHLESSMLPAETLGADYVVAPPTSPGGSVVGHVVRFYGNVDGTTLTFSPTKPTGCPSTLNAGDVVSCSNVVDQAFEVTGSHEFAVSSFQLGGSLIDFYSAEHVPNGDPSMSPMVATEQYLQSYIFLAPTDYAESYMDVVGPADTQITLDKKRITAHPTVINGSWSLWRIPLLTGGGGTHILGATNAVGVQVMGYGAYTSYQYPAGLNLTEISPPPLK